MDPRETKTQETSWGPALTSQGLTGLGRIYLKVITSDISLTEQLTNIKETNGQNQRNYWLQPSVMEPVELLLRNTKLEHF